MKISKVFLGTVVDVEHFDTSTMGNPRYTLTIQDDSGEITTLYTRVNSSLGYSATNYLGKYVNYSSRLLRNKLCIESIINQSKPEYARKWRDRIRMSCRG